jgi:hypothetical protein
MLALAVGLTPPLDARDKAEEVKLPAFLTAKPLKPAEGDSELRKLQKERYNAALKAAVVRYQEYLAGRQGITVERLLVACRALMQAELELTNRPADEIAVREKFLAAARKIEDLTDRAFKAGQVNLGDLETARASRLTAEIELLRAKAIGKASEI